MARKSVAARWEGPGLSHVLLGLALVLLVGGVAPAARAGDSCEPLVPTSPGICESNVCACSVDSDCPYVDDEPDVCNVQLPPSNPFGCCSRYPGPMVCYDDRATVCTNEGGECALGDTCVVACPLETDQTLSACVSLQTPAEEPQATPPFVYPSNYRSDGEPPFSVGFSSYTPTLGEGTWEIDLYIFGGLEEPEAGASDCAPLASDPNLGKNAPEVPRVGVICGFDFELLAGVSASIQGFEPDPALTAPGPDAEPAPLVVHPGGIEDETLVRLVWARPTSPLGTGIHKLGTVTLQVDGDVMGRNLLEAKEGKLTDGYLKVRRLKPYTIAVEPVGSD